MTNKILLVNVSTYLFVKVSEIGKKKKNIVEKKSLKSTRKRIPFHLTRCMHNEANRHLSLFVCMCVCLYEYKDYMYNPTV